MANDHRILSWRPTLVPFVWAWHWARFGTGQSRHWHYRLGTYRSMWKWAHAYAAGVADG